MASGFGEDEKEDSDTLEVVWLDTSVQSLIDIRDYLQSLNPLAAERIVAAIEEAGQSLARFPERCPEGPWPGTRRLLVPRTNYQLIFQVRKDVEILLVAFQRRQLL